MEEKEIKRMRIVHLGKIFANLALFCGVFLFLIGCVPVVTFIWYVIGAFIFVLCLLVKIVTFWALPIDIEGMQAFFFGDGVTHVMEAFNALTKCMPYMFVATVLFAAGAIALMTIFDKYKRKGRVISSSVAIGLGVIGMILAFAIVPTVMGTM